MGGDGGQRRALGATSREPDQSLAALTLEVWARPAVGAASPMSLGSTSPGLPCQRIDQRDYEVSFTVPPPHQDHVDDVVVILIDELDAIDARDRAAQLLVAIRVIAEFLHHLTRLDAEPLGLAAFILRLARGRAH